MRHSHCNTDHTQRTLQARLWLLSRGFGLSGSRRSTASGVPRRPRRSGGNELFPPDEVPTWGAGSLWNSSWAKGRTLAALAVAVAARRWDERAERWWESNDVDIIHWAEWEHTRQYSVPCQ